jgi:hypothetical protein
LAAAFDFVSMLIELSVGAISRPAAQRARLLLLIRTVSLYGVIADLRREHPTPAATQTLDMVVAELGRTRDNLKEAVATLSAKPLPPGGKPVLDQLVERARQAGINDLDYGPDPYDKPSVEPLDEGTLGIGALLALTSVAGIALAVAAVVIAINAILNAGSG